jgi:hypothetical protein
MLMDLVGTLRSVLCSDDLLSQPLIHTSEDKNLALMNRTVNAKFHAGIYKNTSAFVVG